jgi:hypothetical protein
MNEQELRDAALRWASEAESALRRAADNAGDTDLIVATKLEHAHAQASATLSRAYSALIPGAPMAPFTDHE